MTVNEASAEKLVALAVVALAVVEPCPFRCFVVEAEADAAEGIALLPLAIETELFKGEPEITEVMLIPVVVVGIAEDLVKEREALEGEYAEVPF